MGHVNFSIYPKNSSTSVPTIKSDSSLMGRKFLALNSSDSWNCKAVPLSLYTFPLFNAIASPTIFAKKSFFYPLRQNIFFEEILYAKKAVMQAQGRIQGNYDILTTTPTLPQPKMYDYVCTYKRTYTKET